MSEETNDAVVESIPESIAEATGNEEQSEDQQTEFVPSSLSVADMIEGDIEDSSDTDTETGTDDEDIDISDGELDSIIDEIMEEDESEVADDDEDVSDGVTSNTQKRIDQLTAQKKSAEEERENLLRRAIQAEEKLKLQDAKKPEKDDKLTETDIKRALAKYLEEGDYEGVMDVINYKVEQAQDNIRNEYNEEKTKITKSQQERNNEWNHITTEYSPGGYEEEVLAEDADFDIRSSESQLYKLADQIFKTGVNEGKYLEVGGMRKAVEIAFKKLLLKKVGGKKTPSKKTKADPETEGLRQRLAKEQRKTNMGSGTSSKGDAPAKQQSKKSELDEVISERRAAKNKIMSTA